VLLDVTSDAETLAPRPWTPSAEPSGVAKVIDAWSGAGSDLAALLGELPAAIKDPAGVLRSVVNFGTGIGGFISKLRPTTSSSIDGSIGPHRTWRHASVGFEAITTIRQAVGGTVNDVVLCGLSAGYRALLASRGDDLDRVTVRTAIPVSVRDASGEGAVDNRVSTLLYELPIHVTDPFERLALIGEQMSELKGSHMAEAGDVVMSIGNLAPPMVVGSLSRLAIRGEWRLPQHSVTTVTTNVPGPQFPLFCLGREMLEYQPFVPITHGVRVGTAVLSYNGNVCFGVTGDYTSADDVGVLADATVEEIRAMAASVAPAKRTRTKRSRRE